MSNFQILAKTEQTEESSYTIKSTGETVTKVQITLSVPGMSDRVICEMPLDVAPTPATLEQWEMEESWSSSRPLASAPSALPAPMPGEKPVGAMVIFQAIEVREANAEERKALIAARKAAKLQAKHRQVARKAAKLQAKHRQVARKAEKDAAQAVA